jgi:hypothetical protein
MQIKNHEEAKTDGEKKRKKKTHSCERERERRERERERERASWKLKPHQQQCSPLFFFLR